MIKFRYYSWGQYKKVINFSDKDFTVMLLSGSLTFSHQNKDGIWYKDCGMGMYLKTIK